MTFEHKSFEKNTRPDWAKNNAQIAKEKDMKYWVHIFGVGNSDGITQKQEISVSSLDANEYWIIFPEQFIGSVWKGNVSHYFLTDTLSSVKEDGLRTCFSLDIGIENNEFDTKDFNSWDEGWLDTRDKENEMLFMFGNIEHTMDLYVKLSFEDLKFQLKTIIDLMEGNKTETQIIEEIKAAKERKQK